MHLILDIFVICRGMAIECNDFETHYLGIAPGYALHFAPYLCIQVW